MIQTQLSTFDLAAKMNNIFPTLDHITSYGVMKTVEEIKLYRIKDRYI